MADDFEKDNSNFSFEENSNKNPEKSNSSNWTDNPFEREVENPFAGQTQYQVSNENIDANRRQSSNLLKVLLALILSIGLLIAAIFGLSQKKNTGEPQNKEINAQTQEAQVPTPVAGETTPANTAIDREIDALKAKDRLSPAEADKLKELEKQKTTIQATTSVKATNLKDRKFCKLSEAQLYVADAINDLDRVTGRLEDRLDAYKSSDEDVSDKELAFLRTKVEDLSRAEAEIQNFAQPYIDSDLSVGIKDSLEPCKLKDAPKHLAAWLDELKERINNLYADLDELAGEPALASNDGQTLAENTPLSSPTTVNPAQNKTEQSQKNIATSEKQRVAKQAPVKTTSTKEQTKTNKPSLIVSRSPKMSSKAENNNNRPKEKATAQVQSKPKVLSMLPPLQSKPKPITAQQQSSLSNKAKEDKVTHVAQAPAHKENTHNSIAHSQAASGLHENTAVVQRRIPTEVQRPRQASPRRVERCYEYEEPSYSCTEYEEYEEYYYEPAPRRLFQRRGYYY